MPCVQVHHLFVAPLPAEETICRIMDANLDIEGECEVTSFPLLAAEASVLCA